MLRRVLLTAFVVVVTSSIASAQAVDPQNRPQRTPGQTAAAPGAEPGQLDQAIAACLLLGNQEEIAVAQFAKDRLQSAEAKKFAEMMIKDHREAIDKLQRVAPQVAALNLQVQGGQPGAATPGAQPVQNAGQPGQPAQAAQARQPGAQTVAGATAGAQSPMIALQQRVAEECLQLTQKELSEHEGAEFDKCYIGQQIGAHIGMLAKLRGSQEFASPQLQQYIQEATQVVEKHHQQAKQLAKAMMKDEAGGAAGEQARRDADAARRQ